MNFEGAFLAIICLIVSAVVLALYRSERKSEPHDYSKDNDMGMW